MSDEEGPRITMADEARLVCSESRIVGIDESTRRVRHVISTAKLDRMNRMVEPGGWHLAKFRSNPIVLADHEYSIERIIGTAIETKVEGEALVSTTEFASEGLGEMAFRLVQAGLVRAWSVGWIGLKSHPIERDNDCERCAAAGKVDWGQHYTQQELLEYSLVAMPANPDAVMGLQRAGLVKPADVEAWMEVCAGSAGEAEPEEPVEPRSSEFYQAVFSASRSLERRIFLLRAAQRVRGQHGQVRNQ